MAVARRVFSKVITIATKILWAIEQIIASSYMYILFLKISSIEGMQSADLVVLALNVLYLGGGGRGGRGEVGGGGEKDWRRLI